MKICLLISIQKKRNEWINDENTRGSIRAPNERQIN